MMVPIRYNVRSLLVRRTTTLVTALGIALVVFVLAGSMMFTHGIEKTLSLGGHNDIAIVLRKGSDAELGSAIESNTVGLLMAMPGIKNQGGTPLGVAEIIVVAAMEKVGVPGVSNVQLRGVPSNVFTFRPNTKIIEGRAPQPGADEVLVGKRLRGRFVGVELGQTFDLKKNRPAKVVGIFENEGSSYESEVWVDVDVLRTSYAREGMVSSVRVQLESPAQFETFRAAVESDKRLGLQAVREPVFFEKQSEFTSIFFRVLGITIVLFVSVAAMIGAMITMYAAVANRQREIGTLRALGFSRLSILTSFMIESIVLALGGGIIGVLAAMVLGTVKLSVMNFASWSEMVIGFEPTPVIILGSIVTGGAMGMLGGFLPAIRAARVSPVAAMRG